MDSKTVKFTMTDGDIEAVKISDWELTNMHSLNGEMVAQDGVTYDVYIDLEFDGPVESWVCVETESPWRESPVPSDIWPML